MSRLQRVGPDPDRAAEMGVAYVNQFLAELDTRLRHPKAIRLEELMEIVGRAYVDGWTDAKMDEGM